MDAASASTCIKLGDGGLASQLVLQGFKDIDKDPLWSARVLVTKADTVKEAHRMFIEAGADIIETNTYQVSIDGFRKYLGLSESETINYIKQSVLSVAKPVCDDWFSETGKKILVAGSIGPYGACQHDGSEYHGNYVETMSDEELINWHRPRMKALAECGVDYFAFETIPAKKEADSLVHLLVNEFPSMKAWLSFSCKDKLHTNHGELLSEAVESGMNCSQITHVGVNCTSPQYVIELLDSMQHQLHKKPFIVYPNSGETWTSGEGWDGNSLLADIEQFTVQCINRGVTVIGGCCRVTASHISQIRRAIDSFNDKRVT